MDKNLNELSTCCFARRALFSQSSVNPNLKKREGAEAEVR